LSASDLTIERSIATPKKNPRLQTSGKKLQTLPRLHPEAPITTIFPMVIFQVQKHEAYANRLGSGNQAPAQKAQRMPAKIDNKDRQ
jgi:hypothetical protein